jgi:hypothetical protein
MSFPKLLGLMCGMTALVAAVGCAARQYEDPIPVMLDTQQGVGTRLDAAEQARQKMLDDPRRTAALQVLLFAWGQQIELRRYAVDELLRGDEEAFRKTIADRIVEVRSDEIAQYIFQIGIEHKWPELTLTIIHRYSVKEYGVRDRDRMEYRVLAQINPGRTVPQVIAEVFANASGKLSAAQQTRAWGLLNRLCEPAEVRSLLAAAPDTTALVVDLKACAADLGTLPIDEKGVEWLYFLHDPRQAGLWNTYKAAVARLNSIQREGLELRHLAVVMRLDDRTLAMSGADLLTDLRASLRRQEHHVIGMSTDGGDKDHPQRLDDWAAQLCWADLATIRHLSGLMDDRAVVAELFQQADADVNDTSTEYGGVIDETADGADGARHFVAKGYRPLRRENDRRFIPPPAMNEHLHTALAHYHFHAQSYHNSDYAGPGLGDRKNADGWRLNFLVFTFIDHDRLNVDYYQHGGVVVDLGTLRR